jgi:hypothetical protein
MRPWIAHDESNPEVYMGTYKIVYSEAVGAKYEAGRRGRGREGGHGTNGSGTYCMSLGWLPELE